MQHAYSSFEGSFLHSRNSSGLNYKDHHQQLTISPILWKFIMDQTKGSELLTGGNGFLASHILAQLIEAGIHLSCNQLRQANIFKSQARM